ncbi:tetratricopeptide repeat protein [Frankia sp. QA3]|uniref:tetratricopeptide repeat protein n=1 Tax=Frankia sp. QA3 TaxID=710111 RepID=UPI00351092EE
MGRLGRYQDARALGEDVLASRRRILGPRHPTPSAPRKPPSGGSTRNRPAHNTWAAGRGGHPGEAPRRARRAPARRRGWRRSVRC